MKMDHLIEALAQKDRIPLALSEDIAPAPHHPALVQGFYDAQRGHTACPYGLPKCAAKWAEGYDLADENGLAELPRFGKLVAGKSRNRRG